MKTYADGYSFGYDYVAYEGGNLRSLFTEMKYRGVSPRSPIGVGFMAGAKDAAKGLPKRYE